MPLFTNYLEEVFSETELPVYPVLGNYFPLVFILVSSDKLCRIGFLRLAWPGEETKLL